MGRIVPEKNDPTIRELIEGNFRIIYRVFDEKFVEIASILHSHQDFETNF
jgi:plasmid stabilization system protein ParE